ncbi:MAG: polysaccharide deacetylase family protein [Clostridia bacterium]|nr:polysaccharide deacetylase family protein [Clostridia bacterium]
MNQSEQKIRLKTTENSLRILSLFLCVVLLLSFVPVITTTATDIPLLYLNDSFFSDWEITPPYTVDGVVYIPITMFTALDTVYYYSNPDVGTFYLQNSLTKEYLSFSLKSGSAYNGTSIIKMNIKVFHDTIYLPALETVKRLGLFLEMNPENTIVRLSDTSAKLPFSKLISLYTPITEPVVTPPSNNDTPPAQPDENDNTDNPPDVVEPVPVIIPCDVSIGFKNPDPKNLDKLIVALESKKLPASFFLSSDYIENNPKDVLKIYSHGYSIGIAVSTDYSDNSQIISDVNRANDNLRRIIKQKTRILLIRNNKNNLLDFLSENGFTPHIFDFESPANPKTSKQVTDSIKEYLPGRSKIKLLIGSDIFSITSLYETGDFLNGNDIINLYGIDETV